MNYISFIIPIFNEAKQVDFIVAQWQFLLGLGHEVILVDGGSSDGTVELLVKREIIVVESKKGRARQMNAGAEKASYDLFCFLHADTQLDERCAQALADNTPTPMLWGRFKLKFSGSSNWFLLIAKMMEWRSQFSSIITGDQCLFVSRKLFKNLNGFADIDLMEDIEISKRLKRVSKPVFLNATVVTSSRRWQRRGIVRTILLMWSLRLAYYCKVSPSRLAKWYR